MRIIVQARDAKVLILALVFFQGLGSRVAAQDNEICLMCHADASVFEGLENAERLVVAQEQLDASIHGMIGTTCVDCHQDLAGFEDFPHAEELAAVDCSMCHYDVSEVYNSSLHGYALSRGNEQAPNCASCHGSHDILPCDDPESAVCKANIQETCGSCHGVAGLLMNQMVKLPQTYTAYTQSVHGQGVLGGIDEAASCTDCHGIHDLKGKIDPKSRINPLNVSATCGQCHNSIQDEYDRSIHGRALAAGIYDSPTCNDCHGEHLILSSKDREAKTYASKLAIETCGDCHNDPEIISKYSLQGDVIGSYTDSYHGWAVKRGYEDAATCVSCHTAHLVLPEEDPESSVSQVNLVATCQTCHPDSDERFARSYTHAETSITANPIDRVIRFAYILIIILTIGGMALHNLTILAYYMAERRKQVLTGDWVVRLDLSQIVQHMLLTVSFIGLVVTGFALRFPDAWWVKVLYAIGMNEPVRAFLHRFFAVVLILTSLIHLYYILFTKRGKTEIRAMLPTFQDALDVIANLKYYTGLSREKPKFGRYDYTQKAEYWALIWGTVVMALTGFVLWFPETAVKIFPSWIVTASQTVHYYEAWLATLAIIVWHFFFVIFYPSEYPMNWTWITGKMSKKSVEEHHGRWYEEEMAAGGAEKEIAAGAAEKEIAAGAADEE